MKLYWSPRCGSFAPDAVAAEAGLALDRIRVDFDEPSPALTALRRCNPMAQVPTLILDDGQIITESAAICLHFADLRPEAELLPPAGTGDRAWALRWLMFLVCEVYPADLLQAESDRYGDDAAGVHRAATARIDRDWAILEGALGEGPFVLGARFCLVDIFAVMILAWHLEPPVLLARSPKLGRLLAATIARPAIAPLWHAYGLGSRL